MHPLPRSKASATLNSDRATPFTCTLCSWTWCASVRGGACGASEPECKCKCLRTDEWRRTWCSNVARNLRCRKALGDVAPTSPAAVAAAAAACCMAACCCLAMSTVANMALRAGLSCWKTSPI